MDQSRPRPIRRGVIGILFRGDDLLLIRRAAGVSKGGYWCFPGGHVEPGETPRRAIQRELAEELGIQVRPLRRLGSVRVLDTRHLLAAWHVEHVAGEFRLAAQEIAEMQWLSIEAIRTLPFGLPSNARVLELLGSGISS